MKLELTPNERRVVLEALSKYHTIKSAEGKLQSQKAPNKAAIEAAYAPYASLLAIVVRVQEKLA